MVDSMQETIMLRDTQQRQFSYLRLPFRVSLQGKLLYLQQQQTGATRHFSRLGG